MEDNPVRGAREVLYAYFRDASARATHHNHRAIYLRRFIVALDTTGIVFQAAALTSLASFVLRTDTFTFGVLLVMTLQSCSFVLGMAKMGSKVEQIASDHAVNAKQYADIVKHLTVHLIGTKTEEEYTAIVRAVIDTIVLIGDNEIYRV